MDDLEKRFHRAMGGLIGNEAVGASLDENAANELLAWGESETKRIVDQTDGLDDEAAEAYLTPRLRALRLMLRAIGRWIGESKTLDAEARLALWNRASDQAQAAFGESFVLPAMDEVLTLLPPDANAGQVIAWLKNFIEEKGTKG